LELSSLYHWLALERIPRVGPLTLNRLYRSFGSPEAVLRATAKDIQARAGLNEKLAATISQFSPPEQEILRDIDILTKLESKVVTRWDDSYPPILREIYDPPSLLFVRGNLQPEDSKAVGLVGTRNPTRYGMYMARSLTKAFVQAGVTVVSGLARGIDTVCHRTAVEAGGRTIGVLGCGIDVVYPRENRELIETVARSGAVVTEFRPRISPLATNFYRRNRVISGLSKGVVVIEAALNSGSLITAAHAADQNRDVFALPGNVMSPKSAGPHFLIKQGAGLVETADDVLSALFNNAREQPVQADLFEGDGEELSDDAAAVFEYIDMDPLPIDLICEASKMDIGRISGVLVELELNGLVRQFPGKMFARAKPDRK
jgi:DNA processing protein